uniref:Integrase catalytic domain-containing protein n=2 Tax=Micrurus lemniscatus lemniscatus TaxID=129467 RepID=A0A2D4HTP5_MICLE
MLMAHFILCAGLPITAQWFISHVFWLHGLPDRIVSDWGVQFTARFWQTLLMELQVQACLSSTHHPETDGGTERMNDILEQYLCFFSNTQQNNWVEVLPVAKFAYNNAQPASTHLSPLFANYGFHP